MRRAFSPPGSQPHFPPVPVGCLRLLLFTAPAPVPARAGRVPAPCVSLRPSQRMSPIQTLGRSLIRDWRPVCSAVGAAVLGASLPVSPPPCLLTSAGLVRPQPASSSLDLLGPFVLRRLAVCSGWLIFSLSFAIPQFKLEAHKSSLQLPSGHSGLALTLSNATRSAPFCPTCWWRVWASGVLFCWELLLGM